MVFMIFMMMRTTTIAMVRIVMIRMGSLAHLMRRMVIQGTKDIPANVQIGFKNQKEWTSIICI